MNKKDLEYVNHLLDKIKKLEEENKKLKKQVSDAGWEREAAHADDWRQVHEMGC